MALRSRADVMQPLGARLTPRSAAAAAADSNGRAHGRRAARTGEPNANTMDHLPLRRRRRLAAALCEREIQFRSRAQLDEPAKR